MNLLHYAYLGSWFFQTRFLGKQKPLQTVLFITNRCNLQCKHCSVYNNVSPQDMTYAEVIENLKYSYSLGSRFVDFEGGEPTLWRLEGKTVNDLIDDAKKIGFFSCTITTNAQRDFSSSHADSIWVSMDGVGKYHDAVRGEGAFARLEKNIAASGHKALSVNMVVNTLNYECVAEAIEYAKNNPAIKSISINMHTPFPGTEHLALPQDIREKVVDTVIAYKKKGYPIMNSVSGLKLMKHNNFKKECWVTNFIIQDGTRLTECAGKTVGVCDRCGFCMAGEMRAVFNFKPDTILAGLSLRM